MSNNRERVIFKCEECQTIHNSEVDYQNHLAGNKHKKKLAKQVTEIQNHLKKELYEKKGVFVGNLPQDTRSDELLKYISSFGKIEKSVISARFAKVLFENEQSAINFRDTKHVYKNCTLRIGTWVIDVSSLDEKLDGDKHIQEAIAKSLTTNCSIDQQVDALLNNLLMSQSQVSSCHELCKDLDKALQCVYGANFSMHLFGSVVTGLAFQMSDLDVVVDPHFTLHHYVRTSVRQVSFRIDKKTLNKVSNALRRRFFNVVPIYSAKIPIVTCIHRSTNVSCDVSFSNVAGVQNSYLIQRYVQSDPRVKALLVILKYWVKYFDLGKTCLSNYSLIIMGLYYLMQIDNSAIPPVLHLQRNVQKKIEVDGWNCSFDYEYNFKKLDSNITVLDLIQGFFEFYAQFDNGMYVICPLIGKAIPKIFFKNVEQLPPELLSMQSNQAEALKHMTSLKIESNLCVQDPFLLDRNITGLIRGDLAVKVQRMFICSGRVLKEDCVKNGTTGFLKHLFQRRTEDLLLIPSYWRQPIGNNVEIEINVDCYVPTLECHANTTVDDARNAWFDRVFAVVKNDILEKSFLFKVDDDDGDDMSPNKKRKEEIIDGNTKEILAKMKRIICKRKGPDLYSYRKVVAKEIITDPNMSFVEINEAVSKYMMKQNGPVENVMFMCCFHLMTEPTRIILEMSNLGSDNAFKSWVTYAMAHLSGWLAQLMTTKSSASSCAVSVTSPQ